MKTEQKRMFVVLGMHRSGTSAITQALNVIGVDLGDSLIEGIPDNNDKGFFEDIDINTFDNELLRELGHEWHTLTPITAEVLAHPVTRSFKLRAVELLRKKLNNTDCFGIKDPRIARLLPFWQEVFTHLKVKVSYIIVCRNPMSVARSLAKRDGFDLEKGYHLWLEHNISILTHTEKHSRIVVDYDRMMETPAEQLQLIAQKLGLQIDPEHPDHIYYCSDFIDNSLRHTRYEIEDLHLDESIPPDVIKLYRLMVDLAKDANEIDHQKVASLVGRLNDRFTDTYPALRYMRICDDKASKLKQELSHLSQVASDRNRDISQLNKSILERDEQITNFTQLFDVKDKQIAESAQSISERDARLNQLNQDIQILTKELNQLKSQYNIIINSKSWLITKPFRFFRRSLIEGPHWFLSKLLSDVSRYCWQKLPLASHNKQKLKGHLFKTLPFLFRRTDAYRTWKNFDVQIELDSALDDVAQMHCQNQADADPYVALLDDVPLKDSPLRLICFYLPQFHPIPENNAWWGDGFTEWTNVKPAKPQFEGHYQPHIPGELGYYNLLNTSVQRRQIELAKLYGINGFCFYFYWFAGKRLLETPIENYLNDPGLDLPFCLCWANENWSRRWDGQDSDVLIAQRHSPEDDLAFIQYISVYLQDPRYIRINGKPLLLVYRPSLLPSAKETTQRWRSWCRENGIGEIYLAYTQSFEAVDPNLYGFDAAIEFPPNNAAPPDITDSITPLNKEFAGTVYDWRIFVQRSERYDQQPYTLFRSVCPSWDNTARRRHHGTIFLNSSPALYQKWLLNAIKDTTHHRSDPQEQLIFINAWNEWAEGTHLEPDERFGYAWLQATRNALKGKKEDTCFAARKVILVTHDARPHGAQMLALNLAKTLNQGFGCQVALICLGEGSLKSEYAKWTTVYDLANKDQRGSSAIELVQTLYSDGHRTALVNTTVSGYFLETLAEQGICCVALIHELQGVLKQFSLHGQARTIAAHAHKIVFPAPEVVEDFKAIVPTIDQTKIIVRPQGLYKRRDPKRDAAQDRRRLRRKFGLPDNCQIVLGAGYADHRKGIDLFVEAGLELARRLPEVRWIWIGHWDRHMKAAIEAKLLSFPDLKDRFIFPGLQTDTHLFYGGADLFALTSREDPFPSVVLEALDAKLPVIGFNDAGGCMGMLAEGCGKLVTKEDTEALAHAVEDLLKNPQQRVVLGERGAELIKDRFSFRHYIYDLLDFSGQGLSRISAVIPNFNYSHYLPERISSILKQNYPIFEIIFLDDHSTDNSVQVARDILAAQSIDYRIAINPKNSGSVFYQWKKGVELSKGELVWIAEADDTAERNFINAAIKGFETEKVILSYTQSKQIDQSGQIIGPHYLDYVKDVSSEKWLSSYFNNGQREIIEGFSVKNTIPNVSAVVFRRDPIKEVLTQLIEEIRSYRVAGDWFVYVNLLKKGDIYYNARPLNHHRRHNHSVTIQRFELSELKEIARMQAYIDAQFKLPDEYKNNARSYLDKLIDQFSMRDRYLAHEIQEAICI